MHRSSSLVVALLLACPGCGRPMAAAASADDSAREPTSITVFGEQLLLFMEYPHLVRGAPARFLAHMTVLGTGEPVRSGTVTLEIGAVRLTADGPRREGLFIPEGSVPEPGTFQGRLVLESPQARETLDLGMIRVHATEEEADRTAEAESGDEPADAVPFLMEPQWKLKLLLAQAGRRALSEHLVVPARAVPREGMSAVVSSPAAGRLLAPPDGALPRSGDRIEAGRTLALVEPPLGAAELAQLRALEMELDLRTLEVLRAAGEAEARVRFTERERERITRLREEGLSTQRQLEQAEQDLAVARAELEAAGRMREPLERLLALKDSGAALAPVRLPLRAPISGTIVELSAVEGESIEAGGPVVRLLDSSRLWVEGHVFEFDAPLLDESSGARVEFAALPGRSIDLSGPLAGRPYVGPEVDPASRTLLVRYELENGDGAVRAGMLAELRISRGERESAVAIPVEAVVMDQGLPTAYVMLEGELFQKRTLELGIEDGDWVEVLHGVEPGERVATRGAYVLKLAALSPTSFGAGHAH